MTHPTQLCLGTVQFGVPYGITNQVGQVPEQQVIRILDLAAASGICFLDTAQAYGKAEEVLGRCWPTGSPRRLISKLPPGVSVESWEVSFLTTLQRLQTTKLDSFLLHRASDLLSPDGEALLYWLESLRDRGLVERIGISIYDAAELEGLPLDRLQLVQLPLSVYNQHLIRDGTLERLQDLGVAVHARSVLLQGLLLQLPQDWPIHLSPEFRDHHSRWLQHLNDMELSPIAGALGFVRACEGLEAVLVGVLSVSELAQVLQAWSQAEMVTSEVAIDWAWEKMVDMDPRRWPPR